jgi:hypothetical protein
MKTLAAPLAFVAVLVVACGKPSEAPTGTLTEAAPQSPVDFYLYYHARSAAGMSFEEDVTYHSSRAVADVDGKIQSMMERTGKSRDEVIQLYLDLSQGAAHCTTLTLLDERIEGDKAYLEFDTDNTCPEEQSDISKHRVKLVKEDGWKLDEVEIVL